MRTEIIEEIRAERERQVSAEGWTEAHDNEHADGELARAAACYALPGLPTHAFGPTDDVLAFNSLWPWGAGGAMKLAGKSPRRRLVIAGALIVAEIERLDRAAARAPKGAGSNQNA